MSDRRQRQKELRAAKRESERKRASRRELARRIGTALLFGIAVVAVFALPGLLDDESEVSGPYQRFRDQPTACGVERPPPQEVMSFEQPEEPADITPQSTLTATIATSCGDIAVQLDRSRSPETVDSFVFLAREGFYDGQVFYRVVEDFVVRVGDPEATGLGGPGYAVPDEFPEEDFVYEEGVVAMDNRGAGTTGSQFFIVTGEAGVHLTNSFNVLGRVVGGEDTLERIAAIETAVAPGSVQRSLPLETVYIESIDIEVNGS
ncbi:MAG: peptidylprolyl isomerase [Actinobacteria bacterium]|nr:peptidylprolyl isomerase [Actinomycetota bacterium]